MKAAHVVSSRLKALRTPSLAIDSIKNMEGLLLYSFPLWLKINRIVAKIINEILKNIILYRAFQNIVLSLRQHMHVWSFCSTPTCIK